MHRFLAASGVAISMVVFAADYLPARLFSGAVPPPPPTSIGWIEANFDLEVSPKGTIVRATGLRATPGGLEFVAPALRNWTFRAAADGETPVSSHVLVATMIRPPQLTDPAAGQPASDLAPPSPDVPFPINAVRPAYPANTIGDRSVLVEVVVGANGSVERASIVGAASGFDGAALTAARGWTFRPARYKGQAVTGAAYLIFGFRTPVV